MIIFLFLEKRIFLQLRPYEICLFPIFCNLKPKSFLHDSLDQIIIIPTSYKYLKRTVISTDIKVSVDIICQIYHKKKLFVLVYLYINAIIHVIIYFQSGLE